MTTFSLKNLLNTITLASLLSLSLSASISAATLSAEDGRKIVMPFYEFLSNPLNETKLNNARKAFHPEWRSYFSNEGSKGLEETLIAIQGFGQIIPDLNWRIVEVKVAGDTVIVRGEATGTPKGEFFGVPHTGKRFKIMSIDTHTIENGKVKTSYHIEDWAGAMRQLSN